MNIPQQHGTIQGPGEQEPPLSPEERRQRHLQDRNTTRLPSTLSWGERLLPYLFVAMETCWVDAIFIGLASLNFFHSRDSFMPLWAPFVLMAGTHWLTTHLKRRATVGESAKSNVREGKLLAGSQFVFALLAVVTLFIIWSSIYASSNFFLDPRWLGSLLNDILLLSGVAFHIAALLGLSVYFCWRGVRLARRTIEPADIFGALRIGAGIILGVIVIRAGSGAGAFDEPILLLLIPLFLFLLLIAHALAQAVFVRHMHTTGLQGSVVVQERSLFMIIGSVGLLLIFVALVVGTVASPAFLLQVQHALAPVALLYDLLASWLAYAIVLLVIPLFWLLTLLHLRFQPPTIRNATLPSHPALKPSTAPPAAVIAVIPYVKILLPIVFIGILVMAIVAALRVRRVLLQKRNEDQHESVWSWSLFWAQCRAFLHAIWRRFFPKSSTGSVTSLDKHEIVAEPTARTIREIYRAFLHWASSRGYPRKKDETPSEFKTRLVGASPRGTETALSLVTDAYNTTRYGGIVPDASQVQEIQQVWTELRQS